MMILSLAGKKQRDGNRQHKQMIVKQSDHHLPLSDDALGRIFEFVGRGEYRYIALVNRQFKDCYVNLYQHDTSTSMESAVASLPRCLMYLAEGRKFPVDKISRLARCAALYGNLPVLKLAASRGCVLGGGMSCPAAKGGNLEILKWLQSLDQSNIVPHAASAAAGAGKLEVLKWMQSERYHLPQYIHVSAAEGGHLEVLQWLRSQRVFVNPGNGICAAAAKGGNLEMLKWLQHEGFSLPTRASAAAAEAGHFGVVKWLHSQGCGWNKQTCAGAALSGDLGMLRWLRERGCKWDWQTCANAARGGHFDILKWAHDQGCELDSDVSGAAALHGNLEMLQWVKSKGCAITQFAFTSAIQAGHLEVLIWLEENKSDWNWPKNAAECITNNAAAFGHVDILDWAQQHHYLQWDLVQTSALAANNGHLKCLEWAHRNGYDLAYAVISLSKYTDIVDFGRSLRNRKRGESL